MNDNGIRMAGNKLLPMLRICPYPGLKFVVLTLVSLDDVTLMLLSNCHCFMFRVLFYSTVAFIASMFIFLFSSLRLLCSSCGPHFPLLPLVLIFLLPLLFQNTLALRFSLHTIAPLLCLLFSHSPFHLPSCLLPRLLFFNVHAFSFSAFRNDSSSPFVFPLPPLFNFFRPHCIRAYYLA